VNEKCAPTMFEGLRLGGGNCFRACECTRTMTGKCAARYALEHGQMVMLARTPENAQAAGKRSRDTWL